MASIPLRQKGLIALKSGELVVSEDVGVPDLEDDMVLVRNKAIGLNPVDVKMVGALATPGAIAGMDFSGEVLAIGAKARTPTQLKVNDRVFGAVMGMNGGKNPKIGAFAEVVGAADIVLVKMPDHMSFEQGASLGSGLSTIGLALFRSLQIPGSPTAPSEKSIDILVNGGSTATGTLAIQLIKL